VEVWTRPIVPKGSWAFALLNKGTAVPVQVSIKLSDMGLADPSGYNITEVFDGSFIGLMKPNELLKVSVNPTGVLFGRAVKLGKKRFINSVCFSSNFIIQP
jgi:Alpha galactosidase A C-terminal beta sandwich domain